MDVDLAHREAGHGFNRLAHPLLHFVSDVRDAAPELHRQKQIHHGHTRIDVHFHAFGQILAPQQFRDAAHNAAGHARHAGHLGGRQSGDGLHHVVGDVDRSGLLFARHGVLLVDSAQAPGIRSARKLVCMRPARKSSSSISWR